MIFVINFGHGERDDKRYDPGAVGRVHGLKEAVQTKEVGELLVAELRENSHTVYVIQDGDLEDVTNFANTIKPDLFVSIHCNSVVNVSAHGIETYALAPGGTGEVVANAVQAELVRALGLADRGVKFSRLWVLRKTTGYPAILTEIGFISNAKEEALMLQPEFDRKAAHAIFVGICKAYNLPYGETKSKTYGVWYAGDDDRTGAERVARKVKGNALPRRAYGKGMYDINIMVGGNPVKEANHINLIDEARPDWVGTMYKVLEFLDGKGV